jgi:hypothetical protein
VPLALACSAKHRLRHLCFANIRDDSNSLGLKHSQTAPHASMRQFERCVLAAGSRGRYRGTAIFWECFDNLLRGPFCRGQLGLKLQSAKGSVRAGAGGRPRGETGRELKRRGTGVLSCATSSLPASPSEGSSELARPALSELKRFPTLIRPLHDRQSRLPDHLV